MQETFLDELGHEQESNGPDTLSTGSSVLPVGSLPSKWTCSRTGVEGRRITGYAPGIAAAVDQRTSLQ